MKFQIYTFMFRPITQAPMLDLDEYKNKNPQDCFARKQEILNELLEYDAIEFRDSKRSKYRHKQLISRDGITVYKIENYKPKKMEKDFVKTMKDNYPTSLVIIDNRTNIQRIAIERCEAFKNENLRKIIENSFRKQLEYDYLSIDIRQQYRSDEFWELCDELYKIGGIQYVEFHFPYPNLPRISDKVVDMCTRVSQETNSEPVIKLNGQGKEGVIIKDDNEIIVNAVDACSESGTKMVVKPKRGLARTVGILSLIVEELKDLDEDELQDGDLLGSQFQLIIEFLNRLKMTIE